MILAATLTAYEIFGRAREYWDRQLYPAAIAYQTVVEVHDKRGNFTERYDTAFHIADQRVWIDPVSDYELAHPASTHGMDINANRAPHPAPDIDFIGLPYLAPNYSFTLAHGAPQVAGQEASDAAIRDARAAFGEKVKPTPAPAPTVEPSGLREIGTVVAFKRDYEITLMSDETVNGTDCYHLHLQPHIVNGRFRLRDLWIDKDSFATVRAKTALNFVDGPGTQIPWTIDFADVDGARYIRSETADGAYRYARRSYDSVSIRFENVHALKRLFPIEVVAPGVYLLLTEPL